MFPAKWDKQKVFIRVNINDIFTIYLFQILLGTFEYSTQNYSGNGQIPCCIKIGIINGEFLMY